MGFLNWVRGVDDKLEPDTAGTDYAHAVPTKDDILEALEKTTDMARSADLSPVVIARVDHVTKAVRDAIPLLEREGMGSQDSYAIMATATDYLPEALGAYLRLPRDWADRRPVDRGRTALMLLIDQLDLLTATMDKILDAVASADATALIAHGRFLTARFGGQSEELELGAGEAPVADEPVADAPVADAPDAAPSPILDTPPGIDSAPPRGKQSPPAPPNPPVNPLDI